ncbi:MAG TPA: hypothetical protein VFK88_02535 [Gallionella sp.]|nr:hypothetical protein [Gallionella sp.]
MAGSNFTGKTITNDLTFLAGDFCIEVGIFLELAMDEIKKHDNTDFDRMEFLLKALKNQLFDFSSSVCAVENAEVDHA